MGDWTSECETCGDDNDFLTGCVHQRWKELRTRYLREDLRLRESCWFPAGTLDVVGEREVLGFPRDVPRAAGC